MGLGQGFKQSQANEQRAIEEQLRNKAAVTQSEAVTMEDPVEEVAPEPELTAVEKGEKAKRETAKFKTDEMIRLEKARAKLRDEGNYVVADFICPTPEARSLFPADYIIWVDTIKEGRFDDTNKMFVKPDKYDFHVTTQDAKNWAPKILKEIK